MNLTQTALEMRKALQYFVGTLDADTQLEMMLEIPSVYPAYAVGVAYKTTTFTTSTSRLRRKNQ